MNAEEMSPALCWVLEVCDLSGETEWPQDTVTREDDLATAGSRQRFRGGQAVRPEQGSLQGGKQGLLFGWVSKLLNLKQQLVAQSRKV